MDLIFLLAAVVMLIGFVLLLLVEELPLRTMSGIQAQHADAKAARERDAAAATLDAGYESEVSADPGVDATPT